MDFQGHAEKYYRSVVLDRSFPLVKLCCLALASPGSLVLAIPGPMNVQAE
ncbi:hypothetical protein BC943DRAFT_360410 [Umbelopsis sp. AD052]|nr:hypothetical protein BC943DRAFT_360410 [Umbelopsis sp. AD052]